MSDTDGQYPAIIRAMNLNGIQTFSVLDPYAHPRPKGNTFIWLFLTDIFYSLQNNFKIITLIRTIRFCNLCSKTAELVIFLFLFN